MAKYKKRKNGMYEKKVQIGYKPNGLPDRRSIYGSTIQELEKNVLEFQLSIKLGTYRPNDSDILMEDYAREWMQTYKSMRGINTMAMYNNIVEVHIIPELGFLPIGNIQKRHIQLMINERKDHRRTCEQIIMTLNQIFETAIEDELIKKNPCKKIELPEKKHSIKRTLTQIEKDAIKKAEFTPKQKAFVYLLYGCGLRREEMLALTKNDITKNFVTINKVIVFDKNNPILEERTKSHSGCRKVNIPETVYGYLRTYMDSIDTFYLFTKNNGEIMTKSSYDKFWEGIVKKMNEAAGGSKKNKVVTGLTAHIFRHNYATILYYSGISIKKAVELMGHADEKMIMGIYAHLDEEKENAAEKINNLIVV